MKIVLIRNGKIESECKLTEGYQYSIGRRGFNNQIELDDTTVSRSHAKISLVNQNAVLTDLGSSNGTYYNNNRIPAQSPIVVRENDSIKFGNQNSYELRITKGVEQSFPQPNPPPPVFTEKRKEELALTEISETVEPEPLIPHFSARKWGFINSQGKSIIPYKYEEVLFFKNGLAAVKLNGKYGLINSRDNFVLPARFDEILYLRDCLVIISVESAPGQTFQHRSPFDLQQYITSGLALIGMNGRIGFVSRNGTEMVPAMYDRRIDFSSGIGKVRITGNNPLLDSQGKELIPMQHFTNQYVSESMVCVRGGQKWGATDATGQIRIPLNYEKVRFFQNGLAPAQLNGKWGYLDQRNNPAIPFQYEDALSFSEGIAAVKMHGRWGFIDMRGNMLIPFKYERASSFHKSFTERWRVNADGILLMK